MDESRPPLPPFTLETATQKVRMAEDAWNTRDPQRVALAYTTDSRWRNRVEFLEGRAAIEAFLTRKWQREPRLGKEHPNERCRQPFLIALRRPAADIAKEPVDLRARERPDDRRRLVDVHVPAERAVRREPLDERLEAC